MMDHASLFDQAAEALTRALSSTGLAEQSMLMDEALRLNRLALAAERAKLEAARASASRVKATRRKP